MVVFCTILNLKHANKMLRPNFKKSVFKHILTFGIYSNKTTLLKTNDGFSLLARLVVQSSKY